MNCGRLNDALQYQLQLQQNLIHMGTVADEQPNVRHLLFTRSDKSQPQDKAAAAPSGELPHDEVQASE
jgi:hypothetical protein